MPALPLLLVLLTCVAVPSIGSPSPCRVKDDSELADLEYQACVAQQIRRLASLGALNLEDVDPGSYLEELTEGEGEAEGQGEAGVPEGVGNPKLARILKKFGELKQDVKRHSEGKLSEEELLKMVSDYYQWRKRNGGHGSSSGRWGRSTRRMAGPAPTGPTTPLQNLLSDDQFEDKQRLGRFLQLLRRHGKLPKLREASEKREDPVLAEYKQWRGENGYGKASGRWG
jgi:hypothetical protein